MLQTVLIILVVLLLIGAFPAYGWHPVAGGGIGLLLFIVVLVLLLGNR